MRIIVNIKYIVLVFASIVVVNCYSVTLSPMASNTNGVSYLYLGQKLDSTSYFPISGYEKLNSAKEITGNIDYFSFKPIKYSDYQKLAGHLITFDDGKYYPYIPAFIESNSYFFEDNIDKKLGDDYGVIESDEYIFTSPDQFSHSIYYAFNIESEQDYIENEFVESITTPHISKIKKGGTLVLVATIVSNEQSMSKKFREYLSEVDLDLSSFMYELSDGLDNVDARSFAISFEVKQFGGDVLLQNAWTSGMTCNFINLENCIDFVDNFILYADDFTNKIIFNDSDDEENKKLTVIGYEVEGDHEFSDDFFSVMNFFYNEKSKLSYKKGCLHSRFTVNNKSRDKKDDVDLAIKSLNKYALKCIREPERCDHYKKNYMEYNGISIFKSCQVNIDKNFYNYCLFSNQQDDESLVNSIKIQLGFLENANCESVYDSFKEVEYLDLSNSGISSLNALKGAENLMELDLSNNGIIDLSPLAELEHLEELNVSYNKLEGAYVYESTPMLERLRIVGNLLKESDRINFNERIFGDKDVIRNYESYQGDKRILSKANLVKYSELLVSEAEVCNIKRHLDLYSGDITEDEFFLLIEEGLVLKDNTSSKIYVDCSIIAPQIMNDIEMFLFNNL